MPDTFGALTIPLPVPGVDDVPGDPALGVIRDYFKAFLTANCTAAWQAVSPGRPVVATAGAHDPMNGGADDKDLPGLFVWRAQQGQPALWWAADWEVAEDTVRVLWIPPALLAAKQTVHRRRDAVMNGIVKALLVAIERERDASYAAPGDADPTAATLAAAPTAIKVAVATSASPQIYSGAALDGAIGAATFAPPRPFILTAAGPSGSFNAGSHAVVTGTNALGLAQTSILTITGPGAFSTLDEYTAFASIAIDAQHDTLGTFSAGLGAYQGRGSVVREFAGLLQWYPARWQFVTLQVPYRTGNAEQMVPRTLPALALDITIRELLEQDLTDTTRFGALTGLDTSFLLEDGTVSESASFPDAGTP